MKISRLTVPAILSGLLITPLYASASSYCIAVNGGFGTGGTTFIGEGFELPSAGKCSPWVGFTKTASTVVLTTSGVGCTTSDGEVLTVSVTSAGPFFGAGNLYPDFIQVCPKGSSHCPIGSGSDAGDSALGAGPASIEKCTSELLELPSKHD
jgi:hypothetical protein